MNITEHSNIGVSDNILRRAPQPWSALTFSRKYTVRRTGGGGITTLLQQRCSSSIFQLKFFHVDDVRKLGQIHGLLPGAHRQRSFCQMKEMRGEDSSSMDCLMMMENMDEGGMIIESKSKMKKQHNTVTKEQIMHLACKKNHKVETAVMMSKEEAPMMESSEDFESNKDFLTTMNVNAIPLGQNDDDLGGQSNEGSNTEKMKARIQSALQNRDDACHATDSAMYGFEPDEDFKLDQQESKPQIYVQDGVCPGCGTTFQSIDSAAPGYLPTRVGEVEKEQGSSSIQEQQDESYPTNENCDEEEKEGEEEATPTPVCQRCYKLSHYGKVNENLRPGISTHDLLTPLHFQELLKPLRTMRCLIVYIVDLFDFHGSFLYSMPQIVGDNPVLIVANKIDLFPKDVKFSRVKHWVKRECRNRGLHDIAAGQVHIVSCKMGYGIDEVMRHARQSAVDRGCDIYVIGAANAGKSTFINHLLKDKSKKNEKSAMKQGLTVSVVPGTTLNFLKIKLGSSKISLYDTPGLFLSHQITSHLNEKELKAVIPRHRVDHVTLRVAEGKSVLIGGLACVELLQGRPFLLTFFISNDVKLHATSSEKAKEILLNGDCKIAFPPFEPERQKMLQPFSEDIFTIHGSGWKQASKDIVLSGLGWISVTGAGDCRIKVHSPSEMHVMLREPLIPFEARDTTSVFTGGKVLKRGHKKKRHGQRV